MRIIFLQQETFLQLTNMGLRAEAVEIGIEILGAEDHLKVINSCEEAELTVD